MTGAARSVELCGGTYRLSPLSLRDFAEFDVWAEEEFWRKTETRVARMPEGLRERLMEKAYERLGDGDVSVDAMMTVAGTARLVWLSLRKEHPNVGADQTAELVTLGNRQAVQATLDRLNGLQEDDQARLRRRAVEENGGPPGLEAGGDPPADGGASSES